MDLASSDLVAEIHNLQREIKIDEPANIQFTSVNPKNTASKVIFFFFLNYFFQIAFRL